MTDLERYAISDGGESTLNESIEALVSGLERVTAERDELRLTLAASEARMAKARVEVVQTIECIQANNDNETPYWLYNWVRDLRDLLAVNSE